jgi:hypothetical protein
MCSLGAQSRHLTEGMKDLEKLIEFFATAPWAENTLLRDQYGICQLSSQIALNLSDHIPSE